MLYTNIYHNISRRLNRVQTFASFLYLLGGNVTTAKQNTLDVWPQNDDGDDDDDHSKRDRVITIEIDRTQIHFLTMFSWPSPSWYLKLLIDRADGGLMNNIKAMQRLQKYMFMFLYFSFAWKMTA